MSHPRLLPSAFDSEQALLGSLLIAPATVYPLCAEHRITATSFLSPAHAIVYTTVQQMWANGQPVDFILLTERLRADGTLEHAGGAGAVSDLFTKIPTSANALRYIEIVQEKEMLRKVIAVCTELGGRAYGDGEPVGALLSELNTRIAEIGSNDCQPIPTMKENVVDAVQSLDRKVNDPTELIFTGMKGIDADCGPLERGNMLVIGGQTKAGKSMLSGQIALNIGLNGQPVLYISLEMSERELTLRMLSSLSRVDTRKVRIWTEAEYQRFAVAQHRLASTPIHIACRRFELSEIVALCHQFHSRYKTSPTPLAVIVLDYAQMANSSRRKSDERRQQEIAEISRTCKRLAVQLNVLFVLLSQLNDDGRSREARDIEFDANLMVEVGHNKESGERGVKVILARSAPSGQVLPIRIIAEHTRTEDLE